jgi:DIS3-like exonuclease 1
LLLGCPDPLADLNSDVLLSGGKSRNRAVQGDMVVVELLQKSEWRGRATALSEGQGEDKLPESTQSQPMPTGEANSWKVHVGDRAHTLFAC